MNIEGDWEGPIELFEFEDIEEGWINCTTGYYWHSVLGGRICQYADEWYRNWEFDYKPPENEVVPEEPGEISQEVPKIPLTSLSPERSKIRENNISHMKHLRESMKKGVEMWNKAIAKEKHFVQQAIMEADRDTLNKWIDNIEMVLRATEMSPIYVPTIKEEWIRAARQKTIPVVEDPKEPPVQPKILTGPKTAGRHVAKKSGRKRKKTDEKSDGKQDKSQQQGDLEDQPEDVIGESEDAPPPLSIDPGDSQSLENNPGNLSLKPKPKGADDKPKDPKPKQRGVKPNKPVPVLTSDEQTAWYKTNVAYDTKRTGLAATPQEGVLNVTRKRKAEGQPKSTISGGPSANKRKKTTPAKWFPYTQPRTTYMMGNKITPAWGLTHRGDMDPTEDWRVPLYTPPKLTEKQEVAWKEAHKKKKKYRRYKPGQLALKEIKYYQKRPGFIIPIAAIRRLCLEIAYDFKQGISFQMHAYRLLQEAAEWYLERVFKDTNLLAAHA